METIDLKGLDKAAVLAALYNASKAQGMGWIHFTPETMTVSEAREILDEYLKNNWTFDYLKGRVMKVDLSKDDLSFQLYDRDNGAGAAQRAIDGIGA